MADENKFLHLGNSNDKNLYDKFKGKLEKKDIATNNKLLQIFNFFDKDGNGIIETANSKGVNEMQSLWDAVRTSATKNSNSIFEEVEAQELLENSVDSMGKSLADNQVTASDLFAFLKALITPQSKQANGVKLEDLKPEDIVEYTPEEIEDISIQTVADGVRQAKEVFDAQKAQQGAVSDFVNETKETFDTEYASSRVDRYLMNEELCAQLLQKAKEDGLSEKEYLEAKIDLAMELIQSLEKYSLRTEVTQDAINISLSFLTLGIADKKETKNSRELKAQNLELENLKTLLAKLSPEEINMLISKLLFIEENPKGNSNFDFSFGGKNNKAKPQTVTRYGVEGEYSHISPEEYEGEAAPNSLESLSKPYAIYKKMTFEEVFEKERGVQYNPVAIMDYSTKEAHLQFLVGMHNRNEAIKNILHDATVAVDGNNKYGAPHPDAIETCNQNLANQIETVFRSLYSKNAAEAQRVIDEIMGQDSGIKVVADEQGNFIKLEFYGFKRNSLNLDSLGGTKLEGTTQESEVGFENNKFRMPVNAYSLVHLSKGLQQKLEDNYQTALKGKTLDEYSAEVKFAYQMAYGAKNAEDMANAFAQSQQEGVQNTKAVVQGLGMVAMVAGQLIPLGGQAATALIVAKGVITYGGMLTSTLGSVGVSAVENYNKAGGPTEEDKKAMLQELGTSLALVGTGMGIGKGSEAIFRTLVMKNCPKLIAFTAEVGVDATASLLADYAITGQIDLSGEGIAQLQNILVGIIRAKGARNYLNTHAGDITVRANRSNDVKSIEEQARIAADLVGNNTLKPVEIVNRADFESLKKELEKKLYDDVEFPKDKISRILKATNEQNIELAKILCADKEFPKAGISSILKYTNEQNIELAEKLCADENLPKGEISWILQDTDEKNIGSKLKIYELCNNDKDFPKDKISDIILYTDEKNIELAEKLCADINFPKDRLWIILNYINEQNIELAKILCADKEFPKAGISSILKYTNEQNIELAKILCTDKDFPNGKIDKILQYTNEQNIELAKKLCADKEFPKGKISWILRYTNEQNIELAKKLCADKDFPNGKIDKILQYTNEQNIELAEKLCADKEFPEDKIANVLEKVCEQQDVNIKEVIEKKLYYDYLKDVETEILNKIDLKFSEFTKGLILEHSGNMNGVMGVIRFNIASLKKIDNLIKTEEDLKIFEFMLSYKRIDTKNNPYEFLDSDIIKVLQSEKIKKYVIQQIDAGNSLSKVDLEKMFPEFITNTSEQNLQKTKDLSYKTQELTIDGINNEYELNMAIRSSSEFHAEITQKIPAGEVGNINGKLYCNDGQRFFEIKMSKKTFEKLFPVKERYNIEQGQLGDCWLVTSLGALMDSPKGRCYLYKMFKEEGNDILITFPDSNIPIRFKKDRLNSGLITHGMVGCCGLRMIEQAFAVHRLNGYTNGVSVEEINEIFFMNRRMNQLDGGSRDEAFRGIVGDEHVEIEQIYKDDYVDFSNILDKLEVCINDPNKILTFSTKSDFPDQLNPKYDLVTGHAYRIVDIDINNGAITISNPWYDAIVKTIPIYEWLNYIYNVSIMTLE